MSGKAQQQSRLKELISRGREQGYLTYAEVNDHLPEDISDPEQVEDIIRMINDMGINVFECSGCGCPFVGRSRYRRSSS